MDSFAGRCVHVLILEIRFICVLTHYTSTQRGETQMHSSRKRLERYIPLVLAILYVAAGDYASLIRHLRILF